MEKQVVFEIGLYIMKEEKSVCEVFFGKKEILEKDLANQEERNKVKRYRVDFNSEIHSQQLHDINDQIRQMYDS